MRIELNIILKLFKVTFYAKSAFLQTFESNSRVLRFVCIKKIRFQQVNKIRDRRLPSAII